MLMLSLKNTIFEPEYDYKRYAYKKTCMLNTSDFGVGIRFKIMF